MNLRIIPAIPSQPTVIFSLNWHAPPATLSLPHYYSTQLVACQDARIPVPRNPLAVDKAVGLHLLLDSVTFDLSRHIVTVAWVDGQSPLEWNVDEVHGFRAALEDVLECVKMSGVEAEKEKKAAVAALAAKANASGHARSESVPSTTTTTTTPEASSSTSTPVNGHRRHRTASGIFSSLVASFITPPSSPPKDATSSDTGAVPEHLSQMYRPRRGSSQVYHRQHVFHPNNKRETLPTQPVAQSRFLRRQARAKLVDVFRYYVASRLTKKLREAGIVGEELRERGILDDLEDYEGTEQGPMEGTGGFAAAGGYMAFMARSILRSALAEVARNNGSKDEEDSWSSSDESLLLTPKDADSQLAADVPSDCGSDYVTSKKTSTSRSPSPARSSSSKTGRSTPARRPTSRASVASPQTHQIRHLSSVLIGLTQKDKRTTADEREVLEMVKERSLRRRWSLAEASNTPRMHRRSVSLPSASEIEAARRNPKANGWVDGTYGRPLMASPLREVETGDAYFDVPFPGENGVAVPFPTVPAPARRAKSMPSSQHVPVAIVPFDEDAADVTDARDEIPIVRDDVSVTVAKAYEAEDVDRSGNNGRARREAMLPTAPTASSNSNSEETASSDLIPSVSAPTSPSKSDNKKGGHSRSTSCPPAIMITFTATSSSSCSSSSSSSSDSDEEMEITDASSDDDESGVPYALASVIPAPAAPTGTIQTIYATMPKSPSAGSPTSPTFQKLAEEEQMIVRGLDLELEKTHEATEGGISGTYWPHLQDGIFVV